MPSTPSSPLCSFLSSLALLLFLLFPSPSRADLVFYGLKGAPIATVPTTDFYYHPVHAPTLVSGKGSRFSFSQDKSCTIDVNSFDHGASVLVGTIPVDETCSTPYMVSRFLKTLRDTSPAARAILVCHDQPYALNDADFHISSAQVDTMDMPLLAHFPCNYWGQIAGLNSPYMWTNLTVNSVISPRELTFLSSSYRVMTACFLAAYGLLIIFQVVNLVITYRAKVVPRVRVAILALGLVCCSARMLHYVLSLVFGVNRLSISVTALLVLVAFFGASGAFSCINYTWFKLADPLRLRRKTERITWVLSIAMMVFLLFSIIFICPFYFARDFTPHRVLDIIILLGLACFAASILLGCVQVPLLIQNTRVISKAVQDQKGLKVRLVSACAGCSIAYLLFLILFSMKVILMSSTTQSSPIILEVLAELTVVLMTLAISFSMRVRGTDLNGLSAKDASPRTRSPSAQSGDTTELSMYETREQVDIAA